MTHALRILLLATALCLSTAPGALAESQAPTTTIDATDAEQAMLVAIADAQASFPAFWAAYQAGAEGTDRFAARIRLTAGNDASEDIWVTDLAAAPGGRYTATLGNDPETLGATYAKGDTVTFQPMDVVDWGYSEGNKLRGHFTTRALVPTMGALEADQVTSLLHDNPLPTE